MLHRQNRQWNYLPQVNSFFVCAKHKTPYDCDITPATQKKQRSQKWLLPIWLYKSNNLVLEKGQHKNFCILTRQSCSVVMNLLHIHIKLPKIHTWCVIVTPYMPRVNNLLRLHSSIKLYWIQNDTKNLTSPSNWLHIKIIIFHQVCLAIDRSHAPSDIASSNTASSSASDGSLLYKHEAMWTHTVKSRTVAELLGYSKPQRERFTCTVN
jgi:hypothetical protein